jgi:hypothetical protein
MYGTFNHAPSRYLRSSLRPAYGSGLSWNPDPNFSEVDEIRGFNADNIPALNRPEASDLERRVETDAKKT